MGEHICKFLSNKVIVGSLFPQLMNKVSADVENHQVSFVCVYVVGERLPQPLANMGISQVWNEYKL